MHFFRTAFALIPLALAAPTTRRADDCFEKSRSLAWSVTDLYFHSEAIFTTPAHQNPWGYLTFSLANSALDYTTDCSAATSRLGDYFYGDQWFECTLPNVTAAGPTYFRYDRPTGRLDLNQTWTCPDEEYPITFRAYGNGTKALACESTEYHNENWTTPGDIYAIYTTECDKVELTVEPSLITAVA